MPFALEPYLDVRRTQVEALLRRALIELSAETPPRLHEAMSYSVEAGGKRLRPILCLAFAEATGASGRLAEDAAVALEFIHTYSLIHDDLPAMDDDDLRRGKPTSHKVFGEALAILAGDALLTDALSLLAGGEEPQRRGLLRELAHSAGARGMVGGQVYDIATDRPADAEYLFRLHRMKTGALIRAACRLGVLARHQPDAEALEAATQYGEAVGLAFQIADDILDVEGSAEQLGKPAGADAAAGRHTFPAVLGMAASKARAREEVARAVAAVRRFEPDGGPLTALAHYTVERSS